MTNYQQLRADQRLVDQAAAKLRHGAIRAGYAGAERNATAFALALILDSVGLAVIPDDRSQARGIAWAMPNRARPPRATGSSAQPHLRQL